MKKNLLLLTLMLGLLSALSAQTPVLTGAGGWIESAWVKWEPVAGAKSYEVYCKAEGQAEQALAPQLIRNYGTYYCADAPGLKAGKYILRIVPVLENAVQPGTTTDTLTVTAHDRSGYAFWGSRIPGAYQADGTPKAGAVVLYITENTKNTVSMEVTGATTNPCVGLQTILDGYKKGMDNRPLIVRLVGQIKDPSYLLSGDLVIENDNNAAGYITLEGIGDDAVADGWGIRIKNASNVEVRNLATMNCNSGEGDNIGLQQNNDHIWVHHCDFFYGNAGSDADQIKGDGALDCKKSTYVTFSYNHFWDTGKSNLLGLSEGTTSGLFITYHHNWYDHADSRHPRVRYYSAHVYNNYYDGVAKYGVGATTASSVFVEGNYFRNCKYPMLISMQGTDVYDESKQANDYVDMPIFSKEDGGIIKAYNNYMTGQKRFVPYDSVGYPKPTVDFDAYKVTSRNDTVPATVITFQGGTRYNNFDTDPARMYACTPDSPEQARSNVMQYAGRVNGGDFKWTFSNATDDASYEVNAALKTALTNYKTLLIAVQGDTTGGNTNPGDTIVPGTDSTATQIHNFTASGKTSTFFNITGSLSDSKGTVTYASLTLTQCLKMESTTLISFVTSGETTLTLVFNTGFAGKVLVDGVARTATNGALTLTLAAGTHQIAKSDVANLYYISLNSSTALERPGKKSGCTWMVNNGVLQVTGETEVKSLQIFDVSGRLLYHAARGIRTISLATLPQGLYLVRIETGRGWFLEKIASR